MIHWLRLPLSDTRSNIDRYPMCNNDRYQGKPEKLLMHAILVGMREEEVTISQFDSHELADLPAGHHFRHNFCGLHRFNLQLFHGPVLSFLCCPGLII